LFEFAPAIEQYQKAHLFAHIFERVNLDWTSREASTVSMLSTVRGVESRLTAAQLGQLVDVLKAIERRSSSACSRGYRSTHVSVGCVGSRPDTTAGMSTERKPKFSADRQQPVVSFFRVRRGKLTLARRVGTSADSFLGRPWTCASGHDR